MSSTEYALSVALIITPEHSGSPPIKILPRPSHLFWAFAFMQSMRYIQISCCFLPSSSLRGIYSWDGVYGCGLLLVNFKVTGQDIDFSETG